MKRAILVFMCCLFSWMGYADAWYDASTGRTWYYRLCNQEEIEVYDVEPSDGDLVIPSTVDSHLVTSLRASYWDATTLKIPQGVREIYGTFNMPYLESIYVDKDNAVYCSKNGLLCSKDGKTVVQGVNGNVIIPSGVTKIGEYAFSGCENLYSIDLPASVIEIKNNTFNCCYNLYSFYVDPANKNYCSVNGLLCSKDRKTIVQGINGDVAVPLGVTEIGDWAFCGCGNLYSINLPSSLSKIGNGAFGNCCGLDHISIPSSVTEMGSYTFEFCENLYSIDLPSSLSMVGYGAFENCKNLREISIPSGVTKIESFTFYGCRNLYSIVLPDTLVEINNYAFENCENLREISIPSGVTKIESFTFSGCENLYSIVLPDTLVEINNYAFENCENLDLITIPAQVSYIGSRAFEGCRGLWSFFVDSANKNYCAMNGMLCSKDGKCLMVGVNGNVTIPYGVTSIEGSAFYGKQGLTSLVIPSSVTNIGYKAFSYYKGLKSVVMSYGMKCIGGSAFYGCRDLSSVTIPSSVEEIGSDAFYGTPFYNEHSDGLVILGHVLYKYKGNCPTQVVIPEGVEFIGTGAFSRCNNLQSVKFPQGLLSIGDSAFSYCNNLTSIVLPQGLQRIGDSAFDSCNNLTSVVLPQGLQRIGDSAFCGCDSLTSVVLPQGLQRIDEYAFDSCDSLTSVTIPSSVSRIGECAFSGSSLKYFYVDSANDKYCSLNGMLCKKADKALLCGINGRVVIPEGVTRIADSAFDGYEGLISVVIPKSVKRIGSYAFYGCFNLSFVTLQEGIECIGSRAFEYCEGLESVKLPSTLTHIGSGAFCDCYNLSSVEIPKELTDFGEEDWDADYGSVFEDTPFYNNQPDGFVIFNQTLYKYKGECPRELKIPEGIKQIGVCAFEDCSQLESIILPVGLTHIGSEAFYDCSNLKSINIPSSVTYIGEDAFWDTPFYENQPEGFVIFNHFLYGYNGDCPSTLTIPSGVTSIGAGSFGVESCRSVIIPSTVTNIGDNAFSGSDLTQITIPNSVKRIGRGAFEVCYDLTSAVLPSGLTQIERYLFGWCNNLAEVTIPSSVRYIDPDAFEDCDNLKIIYVDKGDAARIKSLMEDNDLEGLQYVEKGSPITSSCEIVFDAGEEGVASESMRFVTSGKTLGPLPTATRAHYLLEGWYTEPVGGTKISATTKITSDQVFYAHWIYNGQILVSARVAEDQEDLGSVSGGGKPVKGGTKVTLRATAKKGAAFAGWYLAGELISTAASYTYMAGEEDAVLEAYFIAAEEDYLYVWNEEGNIYSDVKELVDFDLWDIFSYESGSVVTYSFAGLPTGIKFDTKTQRFVGSPTKAGVYGVTGTFKNANGFAQTVYLSWYVGDVELPEEYDDIGFEWDWGEDFDGLYVGLPCEALLYSGNLYSTSKLSVSGLPAGLRATIAKPDAEGPVIMLSGTPTKVGLYTLTITETQGREKFQCVRLLRVEDSGSSYIRIKCATGYEDCGAVKGEGVYVAGATVRLTAQPAKGYYFAGWYLEDDCETPAYFGTSFDYRAASPSFVYGGRESLETSCFYARFVTAAEDADVSIEGDDEWYVDTYSQKDAWHFTVWSETAAKVTVKNLPAGLKYDGVGSIFVSDKTKIKPGSSLMTLTAQNLSKATATKEVKVIVPNLRSEWIEVEDDYGEFKPGLPIELDLDWAGYWDAYSSFTVSGLPKGLVWNAKNDERKGIFAHTITGAPTVPGIYTITFTAKGKEFGTAVATSTITILPFPKLSVGLADGAPEGAKVTGSGSYAANTKVTLKATAPKGYVFAGWDGVDLPFPDCLNPTLTYVTGAEDATIQALFVPISEDELFVDMFTTYDLAVKEPLSDDSFVWLYVYSLSYPTVTVKGLPAGLKFDAKTGLLSGACTKAGISYATFSFKNLSGYTYDRVVQFNVYPIPETRDEENLQILGLNVESLRWLETGVYFETDLGLYSEMPEGFKISGLPTGLTWSAKDGVITGVPTKAGAYTVKFSAKDPFDSRKTLSAQMIAVVQGSSSCYLEAFVMAGTGTVTGSGVYAAGSALKLTAKPGKGEVFAGWYQDVDCTECLSLGASDYRDPKLAGIANPEMPRQVYAAFMPIQNDQAYGIEIFAESEWYLDLNYLEGNAYWFSVDSLSYPTVSVQKLPAGISLVKEIQEGQMVYCFQVTDASKLKVGSYNVKITAQNQAKNKSEFNLILVVDKN